MPNAILLHGTGGSDTDYFWFSDTKEYLAAKGFQVWWPLLPDTEKPTREATLSFLRENGEKFAADSIVIGHSSACPIIFSLLEKISIRQAILVAGFYKPLIKMEISRLMLQESYDWAAISSHAAEIILINSENDPWGCTAEDAIPVANALGAKLIVNHGQGHMGSNSNNQPYREFDLLKRLIQIPLENSSSC